jgi:phosphate transport system substrate-binding protein
VQCEKENIDNPVAISIKGLTVDNYPNVDASTAAAPLQTLLACKLLGFRYDWGRSFTDDTYMIYPNWEDIPTDFNFYERIKASKTHDAILNLIDKKADFILSVRKMSEDEKNHAKEAGVMLIETPVALDAFIFIVNRSNNIKTLSPKQIQDSYMGKVTNWKDVGGKNNPIAPYVRNPNSGSQELMETLVMKDLKMKDWPQERMLDMMSMVFTTVMENPNSICYTLFYYNAQMMKENIAKAIAVNNVQPEKNTIRSRKYPYVSEVYACIRSDLDKNSPAYKIYELLMTEDGKRVVTESGYVPN